MENPERAFDKAFDEFLECEAHERTEAVLFDLICAAFKAGWAAAGGALPESRKK